MSTRVRTTAASPAAAISLEVVFETLRQIQYDGWLTIESFGFALGEISAAASIWRDIERTPDLIASEGIQFLRASI